MSVGQFAGTAAGGAAGIALGAYGINKGVNQIKDGKKGLGITNTVGGVAAGTGGVILAGTAVGAATGMLGAGAANAWNPVGWGLLIAGAVTIAGAAIYEYADYVKKSTDATEELQKQREFEVQQMKKQHKEEMSGLNKYNALIRQTNDVETAKKLIVEAGIKSEDELTDAKYDSLDALKALTQQYIDDKNAKSAEAISLHDSIKKDKDDRRNAFIGEFLKKYGEDKDYKNLTEEDRWAINEYGLEMQKYIQELVDSGAINDEANKHAKYMYEKGILSHDYTDWDVTESDYRILFREGGNADRRVVGKNMLSNTAHYDSLLINGNNIRSAMGYKYDYEGYDTIETADKYIASLLSAAEQNNKDGVEKYVKLLKNLGYNSIDRFGNRKDIILNALKSVGIESYKTGLNYVPSDNYLANLHEGETVLTKEASDVLREFGSNVSSKSGLVSAISSMFSTATIPIKNIIGKSIKDGENDSSNKDIVDAIYHQTTVLERAINNMSTGGNSLEASKSVLNDFTSRLKMRTNYDQNLVNLSPSMS